MFSLATFSADVTPPLGHPLLGAVSVTPPASDIDDRLWAKGIVILGSEAPIVVVSIDWCEIRNDAYRRWQEALAEAVSTDPSRVLVTSIHQHDAPLADLEAERILEPHRGRSSFIDLAYHERVVVATAEAARAAVSDARPITHIGTGEALIAEVASNRRYTTPDGPCTTTEPA